MSFEKWLDRYYPDYEIDADECYDYCPVCHGFGEAFENCNRCWSTGNKYMFNRVEEYAKQKCLDSGRFNIDIGCKGLPLFADELEEM